MDYINYSTIAIAFILIIIFWKRADLIKYINKLRQKSKKLDYLLSSNITYYLIAIILTLIFIKWDSLKSFLNKNNTSKGDSKTTLFYYEEDPLFDYEADPLKPETVEFYNTLEYPIKARDEDNLVSYPLTLDELHLGGKLI